jgi:hypothetical protein
MSADAASSLKNSLVSLPPLLSLLILSLLVPSQLYIPQSPASPS